MILLYHLNTYLNIQFNDCLLLLHVATLFINIHDHSINKKAICLSICLFIPKTIILMNPTPPLKANLSNRCFQ